MRCWGIGNGLVSDKASREKQMANRGKWPLSFRMLTGPIRATSRVRPPPGPSAYYLGTNGAQVGQALA